MHYWPQHYAPCQPSTGRPEDRSPSPSSPPSILLLEDDPEITALVQHWTRDAYALTCASTSEAAIEHINAHAYDILLLDIRLPGSLTGIDVLEHARTSAQSKNQAAVAIAFTAYAMPGDRKRFLEVGFDCYVPKPLHRRVMLDALQQVSS